MKSPRPLLLTALVVLAVVSPLRADPVGWIYSWSPTSSTISADTLSASMTSANYVTLSSEATQNAFGNSFVVASNITLTSPADPNSPATLNTNGAYHLNMFLKDATSLQSTTLSFTGKLSGDFSSMSANLGNVFMPPVSETVSLGANTYTVTLDSFVAPGPPGSTISGAIGAYVSVTAGTGNPHPTSVSPEPSSLLLCGLGAAGFALTSWRRRRPRTRRRSNNRLLLMAVLAVVLCLAITSPTRAGLVQWSYTTTPGTSTVSADGASPVGNVQLTGGGAPAVAGPSSIVLASLSSFSTVDHSHPETFTNRPWSINVTISDTHSHTSGTLTFSGVFNGLLSSQSSLITNTFTGLTTQSITLGGNTYIVTADTYVPPSIPNASNTGAFGAQVAVRGGAKGVPEPSSLLLCSLGAAGWVAVGWRRRFRRRS
jgi:hypothetical protein